MKRILLYNSSRKLSFLEADMFHTMHQQHNSRGNNNYNAFTYSNTVWPPHFHKNFELIHVMKGTILLNVNETEVEVETGSWAIVLSNQIHSFSVDANTLVWVAVFSEDFVSDFSSYIRDKQGSTPRFSPDETVMDYVTEYLIMGKPSLMLKKSCLYALCDQYLRQVPLEARKTKNDNLICQILDYVEMHYREDISLESVAQHFGYEYHYLSRVLNKSYNIRFKQIVNEYRVDHAIRLLKAGEMSITEISLQCGFQSIRTFNDVFLSITGQKPSEYSKNILSKLREM